MKEEKEILQEILKLEKEEKEVDEKMESGRVEKLNILKGKLNALRWALGTGFPTIDPYKGMKTNKQVSHKIKEMSAMKFQIEPLECMKDALRWVLGETDETYFFNDWFKEQLKVAEREKDN
ncbi:MAG: hypothetical protein ACKKMS_02525 [Candidatus Nealsonbacteria bacterium]